MQDDSIYNASISEEVFDDTKKALDLVANGICKETQLREENTSTKVDPQIEGKPFFEMGDDYILNEYIEGLVNVKEESFEEEDARSMELNISEGSEQLPAPAHEVHPDVKVRQLEEFEGGVVLDSSEMVSRFEPLDQRVEKATNAAKFFYNVFRPNLESELPLDQEYTVHLSWIDKYYARHDKDKTVTRFHLNDLFGSPHDDRRRLRRSAIRRAILQKRLVGNRLPLILENRMIPQKNKDHYLYFSKVYEWRLNSVELVSRFN